MWKGVLLTYLSHHVQTALTFPSERDCSDEDGKSWKGIRGQGMGWAWACAQHHVSWPSEQTETWFAFRLHPWLVKLDSLVVLTNLAKAPDEGWQWTGKHCRGQGWEGRAWENCPRVSWHAFAVHHLHLGNNNWRKASEEVHIILVTSEKTCTSLLGNVCLPSTQHLF